MGDGIHGCTDLGTSRQGLHLLLPQRPLATSALWHKSNSVNWCSLYSSHKTLTCTAILCSLYSNHTHSLVLLSLCSLYSKPPSLTCAVVCVQSVLKTTLTHLCCCVQSVLRQQTLICAAVCSLYSKPPSLTCAVVSVQSVLKPQTLTCTAVCVQSVLKTTNPHLFWPFYAA